MKFLTMGLVLISKFYKNEYGNHIWWKRDTEQCSNEMINQQKDKNEK